MVLRLYQIRTYFGGMNFRSPPPLPTNLFPNNSLGFVEAAIRRLDAASAGHRPTTIPCNRIPLPRLRVRFSRVSASSLILLAKLLTKHSSEPEPLLYKSAEFFGTPNSPPVRLIIIVIHFDWPKQMRERELGELPLAVFLDIHLSHHKRIGHFVLTHYCL